MNTSNEECKDNRVENLPIPVESKRKDSLTEKKQLSIEFCRKILEKSGERYTDEAVIKIRQLLYKIGYLDYLLFIEKRNSRSVPNCKD
jgi:hypothetical protein